MTERRWVRQATRTVLVAAAGAVLGLVISQDLDASVAAGRSECAQSTEICIGIAPFVGLAFGLALPVAACWAIMAVAGIRPLWLTVPAAIMLTLVAAVMFLKAVPGGRLHPAWAFSLVTALALALPSLAASIAGRTARPARHSPVR
jgi:hypothetical protein